jgi:ribosome biogenesis GTPase
MTLDELGWRTCYDQTPDQLASGLTVARVAVEHRGNYVILTESTELVAEASGKLRHEVEQGRIDGLPAVGDWVGIRPRAGENKGIIQQILPRKSVFARKVAGRRQEAQVLAANVDIVFLVSSLTADFNLRRLERYLTLAWESRIQPVIVLSKADLCTNLSAARSQVSAVAADAPTHIVSTVTGLGLGELGVYFHDHRTVALLGSSGVGKSTLINHLIGRQELAVGELRQDGKGRHTTTQRQLLLRPGGGLIIDTPGLRELQLWEGGEGVQNSFADVEDLAAGCKFDDCTHQTEPGCAVRAAVESGELDPERLASYEKLRREIMHFESKQDARLRDERKRHDKMVHRAVYKWLKKKGHPDYS